MGYSSRFTGSNTGWGFLPIAGSAGSTGIPELLTLLVSNLDHRLLPERVIFVLTYLKDVRWADLYAFAAAITLISVNYEEPITRPIFETVMG